jgi:hypothetical protein
MLAQEEQEREYQPRQVTQSQTSTSRPSQEEVEEEDVEMVEHPGGQGGLIPRRIVRARQPVRITRPAEPAEEGGVVEGPCLSNLLRRRRRRRKKRDNKKSCGAAAGPEKTKAFPGGRDGAT